MSAAKKNPPTGRVSSRRNQNDSNLVNWFRFYNKQYLSARAASYLLRSIVYAPPCGLAAKVAVNIFYIKPDEPSN